MGCPDHKIIISEAIVMFILDGIIHNEILKIFFTSRKAHGKNILRELFLSVIYFTYLITINSQGVVFKPIVLAAPIVQI